MNNNPSYYATLLLPPDGKKVWTKLMEGSDSVPQEIATGSPIVQSYANYSDGTQAILGVLKSQTPKEYNSIFAWVFDAMGNQYAGWPIDLSDFEDFYVNEIIFSLYNNEYILDIIEQPLVEQ